MFQEEQNAIRRRYATIIFEDEKYRRTMRTKYIGMANHFFMNCQQVPECSLPDACEGGCSSSAQAGSDSVL